MSHQTSVRDQESLWSKASLTQAEKAAQNAKAEKLITIAMSAAKIIFKNAPTVKRRKTEIEKVVFGGRTKVTREVSISTKPRELGSTGSENLYGNISDTTVTTFEKRPYVPLWLGTLAISKGTSSITRTLSIDHHTSPIDQFVAMPLTPRNTGVKLLIDVPYIPPAETIDAAYAFIGGLEPITDRLPGVCLPNPRDI